MKEAERNIIAGLEKDIAKRTASQLEKRDEAADNRQTLGNARRSAVATLASALATPFRCPTPLPIAPAVSARVLPRP